jgi:hypothetical protein
MKEIESYYPLIGKAVVKFQELDLALDILMSSLVSDDVNVTMAFMATLSFKQKLDALGTVARAKFSDAVLLGILDDTMSALSKAEEGRNRVVHTTLIGTSAGDEVYSHKPKATRTDGLKNGGIKLASRDTVEDVITNIQTAMTSVVGLSNELKSRHLIKFSLGASAQSSPAPSQS